MLKKSIILILLLSSEACSLERYRVDREFRLSKKPNQEIGDAVIVARIDTKSVYYDDKVFDRNFIKMNWCRVENKEECKDLLYFNPYNGIKLHNDYDYSFYSTKPGFYYLDDVSQSKGGYLKNWYWLPILIPIGVLSFGSGIGKSIPDFSVSPSGWNKKLKAPNFVSFETKTNEIVYIGDLYFTFTKQKYWFKGKINLEIQDNYDEAVKYFHYKHPEFRNKTVVKRLAQPGVLLDNYDAGFFW
jgi:hypothetical protein